jgi:hypothetical protein
MEAYMTVPFMLKKLPTNDTKKKFGKVTKEKGF